MKRSAPEDEIVSAVSQAETGTFPARQHLPPRDGWEPQEAPRVQVRLSDTAIDLPCDLGDYVLLSQVARGGMGVVYKARQKSLDRFVALKMIRADVFDSPTDLDRFRQEARMSAGLDHPNIVPIHEVREWSDRYYFTMAFVDGTTLYKHPERGRHGRRQILDWMTGVTEAVVYAHERGIIHRDLKPDNVLIDAQGRPRVTDIGLAKHVEGSPALTQTGHLVGTPAYMAPEQALAGEHPVGPLSDVYGLGGILYFLLTGRAPAVGKTITDVLLNVVQGNPTPPGELNPHVDSDLARIAMRCLEREPERRYRSAQELLEVLKALPEACPPDAPALKLDLPVPAPPVVPPRKVRNRWRWAAVLLLVAVAMTALLCVIPATPWLSDGLESGKLPDGLEPGANVAVPDEALQTLAPRSWPTTSSSKCPFSARSGAQMAGGWSGADRQRPSSWSPSPTSM